MILIAGCGGEDPYLDSYESPLLAGDLLPTPEIALCALEDVSFGGAGAVFTFDQPSTFYTHVEGAVVAGGDLTSARARSSIGPPTSVAGRP